MSRLTRERLKLCAEEASLLFRQAEELSSICNPSGLSELEMRNFLANINEFKWFRPHNCFEELRVLEETEKEAARQRRKWDNRKKT